MNLLKTITRFVFPYNSTRYVLLGPASGLKFNVAPGFGVHYALGSKALHLEMLCRNISRGDLVFDVGANRGHIAMILSKQTGNSGRVIAFEPVKELCIDIEKNLALNSIENTVILNKAVGRDESTVEFIFANSASTQGRLATTSACPKPEDANVLQVQQTTLDLIAEKYGFPNFVKIDVEGAAKHVLEGAIQIISQKRAKFFVELHDTAEQLAVQTALVNCGYKAIDEAGTEVSNVTVGWHSPLLLSPIAL
jgi:FkbM family methyltransferase